MPPGPSTRWRSARPPSPTNGSGRRREREQAKEEAARQKERERRQQAIDKAQAALDEAEREHTSRVAALQEQIDTLEKRLRSETLRWQDESQKLKATLREAKN